MQCSDIIFNLKHGDINEDHLSAIVLNAMMIIEGEENGTIINDGIKEWIKGQAE